MWRRRTAIPRYANARIDPFFRVNSSSTRNIRMMIITIVLGLALLALLLRGRDRAFDDQALRTGKKYFIAMNLFNSQELLGHSLPEILNLVNALGKENCFVSVFESGSVDRTPEILSEFKKELDGFRVGNSIVALGENEGNLPNWRTEFLILLEKETGRTFINVHEAWKSVLEDDSLARFRADFPRIRIEYMAKIRNRLIQPLISSSDLWDGGSSENVVVVFLNDVIFSYDQVLDLINTKLPGSLESSLDNPSLDYDAVCALDFSGISMYDTWVSRDINGNLLSSFYPYFSDPNSQNLLKNNQAVPVFSCWNGIIAMRGDVFTRDNITFRSWKEGEPRSPSKSALLSECYSSVNPESCSASECALIFNDMWSKGKTRFFINPNVRVGYTWNDYYMIKYALYFIETFMDAFAKPPESQIEDKMSVETFNQNLVNRFSPPLNVDCGNMLPTSFNWKFYILCFVIAVLFLMKAFAVLKSLFKRIFTKESKYKIQLSSLKNRNSPTDISKMA